MDTHLVTLHWYLAYITAPSMRRKYDIVTAHRMNGIPRSDRQIHAVIVRHTSVRPSVLNTVLDPHPFPACPSRQPRRLALTDCM